MTGATTAAGTTGPAGAAEVIERAPDRLQRMQRGLPYAGLAVSAALSAGLGPYRAGYQAAVAGLSLAALLWLLTMAVRYPVPPALQRRAVVFYAGLMVLIGLLVAVNPLFGFFGFTGYLQAALLPKRLRPPGIAVNAALMALTQIGGIHNLHGGLVGIYLALVAVNCLFAGVITQQGIEEDRRSRQRAAIIGELAEANRRLHETMEENAGLHAQLVAQAREAGVLDERQRMAGEIHDTIAQGLAGIVTQLEVAERFDHDPERRARHRELARRLARESLAEARRSVQALRPGPLDAAAHLPAAIGDLAERWTQVSGIAVRVEVSGSAVPLSPALEVVLFRTAQEGLANIAKHAGASRAGLTLTYTHDVVVLDVLDDGAGFTPRPPDDRAAGGSYGLTAMRQRLREVGGALDVESAPGDGTALSARVPAVPLAPGAPAAPSVADDVRTGGTRLRTGEGGAPIGDNGV